MNIQQLRVVRETLRNDLNLTEAAASLYTSQSGVSKQIRDLEAELGIQLFVRKGKRLTAVTRAGKGAIELIDRILVEMENLRRYASQYSSVDVGRLVIAATHNQARYVLPKVVGEFTRQYPKVLLELRQGTSKYVATMVLNGKAEIGLATEALDEYPGISTFPCFSWGQVVIVPRGHRLAAKAPVSLADIAEYPIVTYNQEFTGRPQIDATFQRAGLTPDIRLTAMDADVIKTYVQLGLGVGILGAVSMEEQTGNGNLVALDTAGNLFERSVTKVALRRGVLLPSYAYRLIEMLAPHLKETELSPGPRYVGERSSVAARDDEHPLVPRLSKATRASASPSTAPAVHLAARLSPPPTVEGGSRRAV